MSGAAGTVVAAELATAFAAQVQIASSNPEADRMPPATLAAAGLDSTPVVLFPAGDGQPEALAWYTAGRAPPGADSIWGCSMGSVRQVRGFDKSKPGWFYVAVDGRAVRYHITEHYALALAAAHGYGPAGGRTQEARKPHKMVILGEPSGDLEASRPWRARKRRTNGDSGRAKRRFRSIQALEGPKTL